MIEILHIKIVRVIPWLISAVLIAILSAGSAYGQSNEEKVRAEIEKTESLIERAQQPVKESGNRQAQQYLEKAIYLVGQARDKLAEKRYLIALRFNEQAREHALKAIGVIRQGEGNREMVEREIERTEELLKRAGEMLGPDGDFQSGTLLENAFTLQNKARDLFNRNRQKMALTSTLDARELAQKALEMAQEHTRALKEIEKTDHLLERAREKLAELNIGLNPPAFERAERLQELARSVYVNGNFDLALENTLKARQQIMDAVGKFDERLKKEFLPGVLENLERRYEELQALLSDADENGMAKTYLNRAREEIRHANEEYKRNEIQLAVQHTRRAMKFLDEAEQLINP